MTDEAISRFSKQTLAGARGNDEGAPIPVVLVTVLIRRYSTGNRALYPESVMPGLGHAIHETHIKPQFGGCPAQARA